MMTLALASLHGMTEQNRTDVVCLLNFDKFRLCRRIFVCVGVVLLSELRDDVRHGFIRDAEGLHRTW